jgi:hypothetical protein
MLTRRNILGTNAGLGLWRPTPWREIVGRSLLAMAVVLTAFPPALATDWYVDIQDAGCSSGTGGMRDPFCNVADALGVAVDGDTITVMPGSYHENLFIDQDLTLLGVSILFDVPMLDGGLSGSVVEIAADATVSIDGLQILNGSAVDGGGILNRGSLTLSYSLLEANQADRGAGIFNASDATLDLSSCVVVQNTATSFGGGLANFSTATLTSCGVNHNTADFYGGGIFNLGTLDLTSSSMVNNSAASSQGGGLANFGTATLTGSNATNNDAVIGGGILNRAGTVTLTNSTLSGNTAVVRGGGAANYSGLTLVDSSVADNGADYYGGGLANYQQLVLENTTVSGNTTTFYGGGLINSGSAILSGSAVDDNTSIFAGGGIANFGGTTLIGSTLTGNTSIYDDGGGIANFGATTLFETTVMGNTTYSDGGGLVNTGTAVLIDSTLDSNMAPDGQGGGLVNHGTAILDGSAVHGNTAEYQAGGIANSDGATLTLTDSTLSSNDAEVIGGGLMNAGEAELGNSVVMANTIALNGGIANHRGAGIANRSTGTLTLTSSTISANHFPSGGNSSRGGGLWNAGEATLISSTVAANTAYYGGGIYPYGSSTTTIDHTILARNFSPSTGAEGYGSDCGGTLNSAGFNLIRNTKGCTLLGDPTGNLLNTSPLFTDPDSDFTLHPSSAAIDAGDSGRTSSGTDVCGIPRVLDGDLDQAMVLDIGAHEFTHARLDVSGTATPGGSLTVDVTGTFASNGMQAFLWFGTGSGESMFAPFGSLFLDLSAGPWGIVPLGAMPISPLNGSIDAQTPVGTFLVLQAQAVGGGSGSLSNAVQLTIE